MEKIKPTKEEVEKVYLLPSVTGRQAAVILGVPIRKFSSLLKEYQIKIKKRESGSLFLRDKEWLRKSYLEEGKSIKQISEEIHSSVGNVRSALIWMGIKPRNVKESLTAKYPHGRFGAISSRWNGGRMVTKHGYVLLYSPDHPNADNRGYVMEHRIVVERALGRLLGKKEDVHHKNGDKSDNRPENLLVCSRKEHSLLHFGAVNKVFNLEEKVESLETQLEEANNKLKLYEEKNNRS